MLRARPFHASGILLSIAVTTLALGAHAQSEGGAQTSAADPLWAQALEAMRSKDYVTACPKIQEVVRLRPDGLGAKLKLAECHESAGHLASAWAMYVLVEPLAEKANQPDRQKTAHERAEALRPKLAMLTIVVSDSLRALPGLEIKCDDKVVEPAQWGVPLPVDKGRHAVVVTASATERSEQVAVVETDGVARTVTLDTDGVARTVTLAQPAMGTPPPDVKPPEPKRRVVPAVVLGLLAAGGIGSGIGLMELSASKSSDAFAVRSMLLAAHGGCRPDRSNFGPQPCADIQDKLQASDTFHNVAVGAFIAGGAATAGTVLYLLWPSSRAKTTERSVARDIRLTPILGPAVNGLLISGGF